MSQNEGLEGLPGTFPATGAATPKSAAPEAQPSGGFTPGPWRLGRTGDTVPCYSAINGDGWSALALVVTRVTGDTHDQPEGVANARLIAVAPEMHEALSKIEELARPGQELGITDAIDLICDIYNVAREARAKASAR